MGLKDCGIMGSFLKIDRSSSWKFSNGVFRKLYSSLKDFVRRIVKGRVQTRLEFPILYANPSMLDCIYVRTVGSSNNNLILNINGREVFLKKVNDATNLFSADSSFFEPYENIVAWKPSVGIRSVELIINRPQATFAIPISLKADWSDGRQVLRCDIETDLCRESLFRHLMAMRNGCNKSAYHGLIMPAYDLTDHSFRLHSWIWCSSLPVFALIEEYLQTGFEPYKVAAIMIGEKLLNFQIRDGINFGGMVIRWDFCINSYPGIVPILAPNDISMIASYAFLPLWTLTSEEKYLRASVNIAKWILREGTDNEGIVLSGYRMDTDCWDNEWLYVDCGFTMTLYAKLFEITGEKQWFSALKSFCTKYLKRFWDADRQVFIKTWRRDGRHNKEIFTRGQGWALEGLISAYFVLNDKEIKDIIVLLIDKLIASQQKDGKWFYILNNRNSGPCNKGTPLLCYELLRALPLYNNKNKLLKAIECGLDWCKRNMVFEGPGMGGISSYNIEGNIVGKRNADSAFAYSLAYYLCAQKMFGEVAGNVQSDSRACKSN